jgi:hypothetical protein
MTVGAVASATKADDRHTGGNSSFDTRGAVFDDDTLFRPRTEVAGGKQEKVGGRLSVRNL